MRRGIATRRAQEFPAASGGLHAGDNERVSGTWQSGRHCSGRSAQAGQRAAQQQSGYEKGAFTGATQRKPGRERRSNSPEILLGLYREIFRFSRQAGIRYWFAAMEQPLARSLSRMGFDFNPIGPETDYYGPVTPFMADLEELLANLQQQNPLLLAWFNDRSISPWLLFSTWMKMKFATAGKP